VGGLAVLDLPIVFLKLIRGVCTPTPPSILKTKYLVLKLKDVILFIQGDIIPPTAFMCALYSVERMRQPVFHYPIDSKTELRLLQEKHAHALFELTNANRASLRQWLPWVDRTHTVEHTLQFIRSGLQQYAENNGFQCGIWHCGELVGSIGYHFFDWYNRRTSLGYWLGEKYRGQGLMTKAVKALTDYAFNELTLHRIEIRCAVQNRASCAIPERLGFTLEGVCRETEWLYDRYVDHNLYSMLRQEWIGTPKSR
jgi:ribosomal-protein-serine acetyltransferase